MSSGVTFIAYVYCPGASPTPTVTASITPSVSQSPTPTITASVTASLTPTQTVSPTASITPTITPTHTCDIADYSVASGMTGTWYTTSTDIGLNANDAALNVSLPFTFPFFGSSFSSANISTNGNIQFNSIDSSYFDYLPYQYMTDAIFPAWHDYLTSGTGNGVFTSTIGTAPNRIFVVEWKGYRYNNTSKVVNFQAQLSESGKIEFVFGTYYSDANNPPTIGLQKGDGSRTYKLYSDYDANTYIPSGLTITYQPECISPLILDECDPLYVTIKGTLFSYSYTSNLKTYLYNLNKEGTSFEFSEPNIAITSDKLWVSVHPSLVEYNITKNPWSITYNRTLALTNTESQNGLTAKNNSILYNSSGKTVNELNISGSSIVKTPLFVLPNTVSGSIILDLIYNVTTDHFIIASYISFNTYRIGEYTSAGTVVQSATSAFKIRSLIQTGGVLYGIDESFNVYSIDPTTFAPTYVKTIPGQTLPNTIVGGAQSPSCYSLATTPPPTSTVTPTVTPSFTSTLTASATAASTPGVTPSPTSSSTPTLTPTITASITASATAAVTPGSTQPSTPTPTASSTPTLTPTITASVTASGTAAVTPGSTPPTTPTPTASVTPTITASVTASGTPASTPGVTPSPTASSTATVTPTVTASATAATTPGATPSPTASATPTLTPTQTASATAASTPGVTPSPTASVTPTLTPTQTASGTPASTPGATPSQTASGTAAATPGATPTQTPSGTAAVTPTRTPTQTASGTPASTPGGTPTSTPNCSAPVITDVTRNHTSSIIIDFTLGTNGTCTNAYFEYSLDGTNWFSDGASACSSPKTMTISPDNQRQIYVRMYVACSQTGGYSSYSNTFHLTWVSSFLLYYAGSATDICAAPNSFTYYSDCATLTTGCFIYTDSSLTTKAIDQYYSFNSTGGPWFNHDPADGGIYNYTTACSCPSYGTTLSYYCDGTTYYRRFADGSCGYYDEVVEYNSITCGGGGSGYNCDCGQGCMAYPDPCSVNACFSCLSF